MVQAHEFTFPSTDGVHEIRAVRWAPKGKPRAAVQLVHGIAEHILRYEDFARFLAERGFLVTGNDHLGHGGSCKSPEEQGFFKESGGWDAVVADVRRLYDETRAAYPDIPYFILGHSMGSFILRTFLIRYNKAPLAGAIISGTGYYAPPVSKMGEMLSAFEVRRHGPRGTSSVFQALSSKPYNKRFRPNRTAFDWLSRDERVVDKYIADSACGFAPSSSMVRDMMGGVGFICSGKNVAEMEKALPILFVSGEEDPVGSYGKGVKKVYEMFLAAGCSDVTLKLYPGGRHEMLNELNRDEVYHDLLAWLEKKEK